MADFSRLRDPADPIDHIMRRKACRLVNNQNSMHCF